MTQIIVNKISFDNEEVKIKGLKELLSNVDLWSKEDPELQKGYTRKVIKENGKRKTILKKQVEVKHA